MEIVRKASNADDLFQILSNIPQEQRKRLTLEICDEESNILRSGELNVYAFETTETEGCIERGFRIERQVRDDES